VSLPSLRPSAARALEEPWLRDGIAPDPSLSAQLAKLSIGKDELPDHVGGDTTFSQLDPFTYMSKSSSGLYTAESDTNKKYGPVLGDVKTTTEINSNSSVAANSVIGNESQRFPRPKVSPLAEAKSRPSAAKRSIPLASELAALTKSQSNSNSPSTLIREIGHHSSLKGYSGADSADTVKARASNSRRIANSRELSHDVPFRTSKTNLEMTYCLHVQGTQEKCEFQTLSSSNDFGLQ
jgi:hypothetical protein